MIWLQAVGVFLAASSSAWLWALYFRYAGKFEAAKAATTDVLIIAVGSLIVIAYMHDWRVLLADFLGTWIGTYVSVRRNRQAAATTDRD